MMYNTTSYHLTIKISKKGKSFHSNYELVNRLDM